MLRRRAGHAISAGHYVRKESAQWILLFPLQRREENEQPGVKGWEDVGVGEQKVPFSSKDVFLN